MFARTERLLLRPGWVDDAPALVRAIGTEKIARNLARVPWPYALGDAETALKTLHGQGAPEFLIFLRTDAEPELVGGIGINEDGGPTPELGYWIAEPHWGKGYASEAARAVIDIARDSLRYSGLRASHFIDNPASARVLRKAGFRPTGRIAPHYSAARRSDVPAALYALEFTEGEGGMCEDRMAHRLKLAA